MNTENNEVEEYIESESLMNKIKQNHGNKYSILSKNGKFIVTKKFLFFHSTLSCESPYGFVFKLFHNENMIYYDRLIDAVKDLEFYLDDKNKEWTKVF
ncbi:MAG: hypothetical protein ACOCV1_06635 [Bacillota bacterium]